MNKKPKKSESLVKSGIQLSILTLFSRIMGLIREMTRASFLGTSIFADTFSTAFVIPNFFRRLFAENSITVAFIPTFKEYLSKGNDDENKRSTQEFLNSIFTLITFLTAIVVVIGVLIMPLISPFFCKIPSDINDPSYTLMILKRDELTFLTRIMFPYLFTISIAAFFQGILNGCKIFAPSGFTPVLFNGIVVLATYLLTPLFKTDDNAAIAMSIGVVIGGTVQALFQLPFVLKTGWKVAFTGFKKAIANPGTKKVIALILPTIIGMAAYQVNDAVSTLLANRAAEGIASSLQYSLRLQELILGIFAVSIGTVILPDLSGLANEKKWSEFNNMLIQAIKIITMITIPVTFYSIINGKEMISLLYKSNKFTDESVLLTLGEFKFHIAGLFFIAVNRIISPAFYAQGNTKLPTLAGIISFVSNTLLALVLVFPMGGNGIALALTIASIVNTIFLFLFMKKMNSIEFKKIVKVTLLYIVKLIVFSIVASIPCYLLRPYLVEKFSLHTKLISQGLPLLISLAIFLTIGILELLLSKDSTIMILINKILKKVKK